MTRNEIYYKMKDAIKAAKQWQKEHGGNLHHTSRDDSSTFIYEDARMSQMKWSGEVSALAVVNCKDDNNACFAWWEE